MELEQLALQLCPPLSPLDREILRAAIAGESYQTVADKLYYCHEHVRERGAALFRAVSIRLGRDISKKNFREELERIGGLISEATSAVNQEHRWRHSRISSQKSARNYQVSLG